MIAAISANLDFSIRQDSLAFLDEEQFFRPVELPVLLIEHAAEQIFLVFDDEGVLPVEMFIVLRQLWITHDLRFEPCNGRSSIGRAQPKIFGKLSDDGGNNRVFKAHERGNRAICARLDVSSDICLEVLAGDEICKEHRERGHASHTECHMR